MARGMTPLLELGANLACTEHCADGRVAQGTPNLGRYVRAIPHPGGFRMPANGIRGGRQGPNVSGKRDLPYDVWAKMSPHGQHVCREIVAEPGEEVVVDWAPDYGKAGTRGQCHAPSCLVTLRVSCSGLWLL